MAAPTSRLPQVYTEDPDQPGLAHSNLGMYRVQLSGGQYEPNREVGLHYQIHRGIGVHHAAAHPARRAAAGERVRRRAAGDDGGRGHAAARGDERTGLRRRVGPAARADDLPRRANCRSTPRPISASRGYHRPEAAASPRGPSAIIWAITAWRTISRCCASSTSITARGAIWPFTVVGRPPQEDTIFGAIDPRAGRAGHSEGDSRRAGGPCRRRRRRASAAVGHRQRALRALRGRRRPRELLTLANALLGHGQLSLAKYLWIAAGEDDPRLGRAATCPSSSATCWNGSIGGAICTSRPARRIDTLDYSRRRAERRIESW